MLSINGYGILANLHSLSNNFYDEEHHENHDFGIFCNYYLNMLQTLFIQAINMYLKLLIYKIDTMTHLLTNLHKFQSSLCTSFVDKQGELWNSKSLYINSKPKKINLVRYPSNFYYFPLKYKSYWIYRNLVQLDWELLNPRKNMIF